MKRLQASLALTAALLALPAVAADRSETISLAYVSAVELEQFLTQPPTKRPSLDGGIVVNGPLGSGGRTLIPQGITAWGVDVSTNTLSVSGSEDGLAQLKRIIRMVDVPPRRLELSLQLHQVETAEAAALREDPAALANEGLVVVPLLTPASLKQFEGRAPTLAAKLLVSNFRAATVRVPSKPGSVDETLSFTPQLNGDGSITVVVSGLNAGEKSTLLSVRRLYNGASALVLDRTNRAWLISPKVLPDAAPEQKRP